MNDDGLQKLKDIGAQKIYEDTHIPVEHVQAVLYASFDGLTKVQFLGFISILQRDYNVDLSELKSVGLAYYAEKTPVKTTMEDGVFVASKKPRNFTFFYILLALAGVFVILYYTVEYADKNIQKKEQEKLISEDIKKESHVVVPDVNRSQKKDENITVIETNTTQEVVAKKEKAVNKTFKIIAKSKVWMGYIDVKTNKKNQKTFVGEFALDPTKEWLLVFGHSYVDVVTGVEKKKFHSNKTLRLLYKEGAVKELTLDEFKILNRGSAW